MVDIQVHSYQSKEIKERKNTINEIETGGLEHFDIDIYRNVDLIGGKPFERIRLRDLYGKEIEKCNFIGYNEYSREEFITDFLSDNPTKSDLSSHKLGIEILSKAAKIAYNANNKEIPIEKIKMK